MVAGTGESYAVQTFKERWVSRAVGAALWGCTSPPCYGQSGPGGLGTTEETELGEASTRAEAGLRHAPALPLSPQSPFPASELGGP